MNKRPMNYILSFLLAVVLAAPMASMAEDAQAPMAETWMVILEKGTGFFGPYKEHLEFRAENGDPWRWQLYLPLLGDNTHRAAVRHCCFNWSDLDAYREWGSSNPQVNEHFQERVTPHAVKYEHYLEIIDWKNSHWSEENGPYPLFEVVEFELKAGHAAAFVAAKEKMSQIAIDQGWAKDQVWLWTSIIGGKQRESLIIPRKNFADFDAGGGGFLAFLTEQIGSAETAEELTQQFSDATWSFNFQIWQHQQEFSMKNSDD